MSSTRDGGVAPTGRVAARLRAARPAVPLALLGGGLALLTAHLPLPGGSRRWDRTNHRGATVSLTSGPALAVAAAASARSAQPAALVAGLLAALLGGFDDAAGDVRSGVDLPAGPAKGFRGHLGALRGGQVTTGAAKLVGIGLAGPLAVALLPGPRTPVDVVVGGGVVAGCANLLNLLDLRPGRALKVGMVAAAALGQPGPLAAALTLLPADLAERTMLGDLGANALGAVLGLALVERCTSQTSTAAALAVLIALTALSEVVSYNAVIDAVGPLRALDRLGRKL